MGPLTQIRFQHCPFHSLTLTKRGHHQSHQGGKKCGTTERESDNYGGSPSHFKLVTHLVRSSNRRIGEDRLPHHFMGRDDFLYSCFEVTLRYLLSKVYSWFRRC